MTKNTSPPNPPVAGRCERYPGRIYVRGCGCANCAARRQMHQQSKRMAVAQVADWRVMMGNAGYPGYERYATQPARKESTVSNFRGRHRNTDTLPAAALFRQAAELIAQGLAKLDLREHERFTDDAPRYFVNLPHARIHRRLQETPRKLLEAADDLDRLQVSTPTAP